MWRQAQGRFAGLRHGDTRHRFYLLELIIRTCEKFPGRRVPAIGSVQNQINVVSTVRPWNSLPVFKQQLLTSARGSFEIDHQFGRTLARRDFCVVCGGELAESACYIVFRLFVSRMLKDIPCPIKLDQFAKQKISSVVRHPRRLLHVVGHDQN